MTAATSPYVPCAPLAADEFRHVLRRAIFDCCKWDPQLEDSPAIASVPLVLTAAAWRELRTLAQQLAAETLEAEAELTERPELHAALGLPWRVRRALRGAGAATAGVARLVRFDFHWTTEGWRISEANTDVPGGMNEASGLPLLMAPHAAGTTTVGDVSGAYARAVLAAGGERVALLHATAYTDDHQVMEYLSRRMRALGGAPLLASPANLRWGQGRATLEHDGRSVPVGAIVRFFPGEWLPNLGRSTGWQRFFRGGATPVSNPATALLTQSKRFPLLWNRLSARLPTWRALLPETHDPRRVDWRRSDEWVMKPALGRVGELVGMRGVTAEREWRHIMRWARWWPAAWVAQRRFATVPLAAGGRTVFPCVGVYTVDARVVGAYGRLAPIPLTDWRARDAAVLVQRAEARRAATVPARRQA